MSCSAPGPARSQSSVNAAAVERLMPAQQCTSIGALAFQPRPNALFEVGWFSAHLGRAGVILLVQGKNTSLPSDLDGVIQLRFQEDVSERAMDLRNELVALELIE